MDGFAEYDRYDGLGLAALIRKGEVTAVEVLDAAIARIEARNPTLNAVIHPLYEQAHRAVAEGLPDGPFRGVPFLLKDLYTFAKGAPCHNGSRLFAGFIAEHDDEMVTRHRRAGLVIVGKTNTSEFGISVTTEPAAYGATRNPWNRAHVAGGSSGGAAAAVAAGMVPLAHASDGGGSIRCPASACGLFGLKPRAVFDHMDPFDGENRYFGQARCAARCGTSGKHRNAPEIPSFLTEGRVLLRCGGGALLIRCPTSHGETRRRHNAK